MKPGRTVAAVTFLSVALASGALSLKLGSIAPQGSPWDQALKTIGAEWSRISGGEVSLKVYGGSVAGGESDILRKIRIGQLQGGLLTMTGLQAIWNGMKAVSFPLFIHDDAEFGRVLGALAPAFERELAARGFDVAFWTTGGWLYFFTRAPVVTPGDLRGQKLYVSGDPDEVLAWRTLGFQVVPMALTEVTTGLQSGMIDGMASSPLVAASNQWFAVAANMCSLRLSPLYGAMVVSTKAWESLAPELRLKLLEAARSEGAKLGVALGSADGEAIAVMRKYGLRITEVPDAVRAEWEAVVARGFGMLIGTAYDAGAYEAVRRVLEDTRSSRSAR